jgi:uncharacterized small protein (DUF1192 family)
VTRDEYDFLSMGLDAGTPRISASQKRKEMTLSDIARQPIPRGLEASRPLATASRQSARALGGRRFAAARSNSRVSSWGRALKTALAKSAELVKESAGPCEKSRGGLGFLLCALNHAYAHLGRVEERRALNDFALVVFRSYNTLLSQTKRKGERRISKLVILDNWAFFLLNSGRKTARRPFARAQGSFGRRRQTGVSHSRIGKTDIGFPKLCELVAKASMIHVDVVQRTSAVLNAKPDARKAIELLFRAVKNVAGQIVRIKRVFGMRRKVSHHVLKTHVGCEGELLTFRSNLLRAQELLRNVTSADPFLSLLKLEVDGVLRNLEQLCSLQASHLEAERGRLRAALQGPSPHRRTQ